MQYTYKVIETDGGGLCLFVFENNNLIYGTTGFEYIPGRLQPHIQDLLNGSDPRDWDNNDQGIEEYNELIAEDSGCEIVADNDGVYPDRMGHSAQVEFGFFKGWGHADI